MIRNLFDDVCYGVRMLIKQPGFSAAAILTLALGIGANTAIFSVVNAVLLQPLPYPQPQQLVCLKDRESVPDLEEIVTRSRSFEALGGVAHQALDYTGNAEPVQVRVAMVNADLFKVLGVNAALGRTITPQEDQYGAERVVVLSHGFWKTHFAGQPNAIGQTIPLSGNLYAIIGVMPADFKMPRENPDVWASVRVVGPLEAKDRGVHILQTYLRLKPGVTLAQAQGEMDVINQQLAAEFPDENKRAQRPLIPLHEVVVGETRPALLVLFGAVALVLLAACANFSNLLLARAASRQHEFAIRAALGAGRSRLVRQIVTESLLLSVIGGVLGLMLALWGVDILMALKPTDLPLLAPARLDRVVLGFTLGVSVLTGIVFGLAPALSASRPNTNEMLKEGGRSGSGGHAKNRARRLLVISEIALGVMLLIGAGLLIKGFVRLRSVNPGFDSSNLVTMRVQLPEARYKEIPKQTQFRQDLLQRLNNLPGVEAAMISELPLSGSELTHKFVIEGRRPRAPGDERDLQVRSVGGNYFHTMRIPILRGRDIAPQDNAGSPIVGLVNQSFVREYFPNEDPIGKRFRWARDEKPAWITIVGIVGDVKQFALNQPEEPAFYYSYAQIDAVWKRWMFLVVRSQADPAAIVKQVKEQVWAKDKLLPVSKVHTMTEVLATSIASQRFNMTLMAIFGFTALFLAAIGIYGVIAFSVAQRTREIGVRMALGAQQLDVLKLILNQGMGMVGSGIALGLLGAFAATRVMATLLFGVQATDPATFLTVSFLLGFVALVACLIPARRASKVDPIIALRYE
jgi:putative ABC transport system permease protein